MDNIIKIILRQTGGLAEMIKTIPLYVGMYNTAILDVYVPMSLVSEGISVKAGAILTANDGTKATTDSLPMTYKEQSTLYGQEYSVYELNPFPANFLTYAGQQDIIINIVTIEDEEVASVVTTQICKVDVLDSALIPDEELNATAVDLLSARITANEQNISTNTENIGANTEQIAQNVLDIAQNSQDIADIQQNYTTNENPVGDLVVDTLTGITTKLNQLVQQVEGRNAEKGDVIMVTLEISGQTDEIYKYFYTASGWKSLKMPAFESASNTDKGIIQGTLGENKNTQVDITGGKVNAIYVKDANGVLRDIREYANTTKQSIDSIISGATKVGYSQKTDNDANGNNIVSTYMTKNAGATKQDLRDYALPREFNDIYYLSANNLITPTRPTNSIQYQQTINSVGTYQLVNATLQTTADFELSNKNSYQNVFYISSTQDVTCQFRLDTKQGNSLMNTELSNEVIMLANNIYKVQFNDNFNLLDDAISFEGGNPVITQVLSVVSTDSVSKTFTVYSNSSYLSTFNLNTNKYLIRVESGELGEIRAISSTGTLADNIVTFAIGEELIDNTLVKFKLAYTGTITTNYIKVVDSATSEEYYVITPYNSGLVSENNVDRPKVEDLEQTSVTRSGGITTIEFVALIDKIEGYGTKIIVNEDNLNNLKNGNITYDIEIANVLMGVKSSRILRLSSVANLSQGDLVCVKVTPYTVSPQNFTYYFTVESINAEDNYIVVVENLSTSFITLFAYDDIIKTLYKARSVAEFNIDTKEDVSNKVSSVSASSNNKEYPSAKCLYDTINNSGFITNTVNNLTNYYLKSETYTQAEVEALISAIPQITFTIVASLPTASASNLFNTTKTVYMVLSTNDTSDHDYYNEYICIEPTTATYQWEKIGDTQIDLSNYMTKTNPTGTGSLSLNRKANTTFGNYSTTEGYDNTASGDYSHAEGNGTVASGAASHAEGYDTTASQSNAHAEGLDTVASGRCSHAEGDGTIAQRHSQHVFGAYNIADTTGQTGMDRGEFVEIVGNGSYNTPRSNARTLDWQGNEVLAGTSQATGFKTANGTGNKLFADNGTAIEYQSSQTNSANKIVQRDANRDVLVPSTPTSNNGATSKSYVDNLISALSPTSISKATPNTTYINTGDCYYVKIGKIVFVQLNNVRFNAVYQDHDATIFSGLPKNVGDWTTIVANSWLANQTVRLAIHTNATELKNYWSGFTPSSSDHSFTGMCMYLTE